MIRRYILEIICLILWLTGSAQSGFKGKVLDADTKEPLAFCHVVILQQNTGLISNEQGVFQIAEQHVEDSLVFSYIGYQSITIPVSLLREKPEVLLQAESVLLDELVVYADDQYLFDAIHECRKKIRSQRERTTKAYFQVNTHSMAEPLELIQCYYNAELAGGRINALDLKNGRVGLLGYDNWYFVSLETSRAITFLDLLNPSQHYPGNPLTITKKQMRKRYELIRLPSFSGKGTLHIAFKPKKEEQEWFAGEIWIDQESHDILRIELNADNASVHPFSLLRPYDILEEVDFRIAQTYRQEAGESTLQHVDFNYSFQFNSYADSIPQNRSIATRGVLYAYDLDKPFLLPHYRYDERFDDYRKISLLPYNPWFWSDPPKVAITTADQADLTLFNQKGVLLNFRNNRFGRKKEFFEVNHLPWSAEDRIIIKNNLKEPGKNRSGGRISGFASDKYHLDVQIFFDVNVIRDTIFCLSETIFDTFNTYYDLPEEDHSNCFINIYFDLCEIARREMQEEAGKTRQSVAALESLYEATLQNLEKDLNLYQKEVQLGTDREKLKKWNDLVKAELGIDNMALFNLSVGE